MMELGKSLSWEVHNAHYCCEEVNERSEAG